LIWWISTQVLDWPTRPVLRSPGGFESQCEVWRAISCKKKRKYLKSIMHPFIKKVFFRTLTDFLFLRPLCCIKHEFNSLVLWCLIHVCFVQVTTYVALPTRWRASVHSLFYCYHTFLDHTTNSSRKLRSPRRVSASVSAKQFSKLSLVKHRQNITTPILSLCIKNKQKSKMVLKMYF